MPKYTFKQQLILTIIDKGPDWGSLILGAFHMYLLLG